MEIPEPPARVDLCTLVRTIFVSAPLALLFNALTVTAVLGSVGYFLFGLYLFASTVGFMLVFISVIAAIFGSFYFSIWAVGSLARAEVTQEIVGVASEYFRAKKARICPIIEMKEMAQ